MTETTTIHPFEKAGLGAAPKAEGFYKQLDGIAFGEVRLTD